MNEPHAHPDSSGAQRRAARLTCRASDPDLFFASLLLGPAQRHALYCVHAVARQLLVALNLAGEAGGCEHAGEAGGCEHAGDLDQRRVICTAMLDRLYSGEAVGVPELDGFPAVAEAVSLPRQMFEDWLDGCLGLAKKARFATWNSLRGAFERSAGNAALIAAHVLHEGAPLDDTRTGQVKAWACGMQLAHTISAMPGDWRRRRLLIPLDDLTRCGLSERRLAAMLEAGAADDALAQLVRFQCARAAKLLDGGSRWVSGLPDRRDRRAAWTYEANGRALLEALDHDPQMMFRARRPSTIWSRLKRARSALRGRS